MKAIMSWMSPDSISNLRPLQLKTLQKTRAAVLRKVNRKGLSSYHMSLKVLKVPRKDDRKGFRQHVDAHRFRENLPTRGRFVETAMPSGDWKAKDQ
jgi:hypothetical protein